MESVEEYYKISFTDSILCISEPLVIISSPYNASNRQHNVCSLNCTRLIYTPQVKCSLLVVCPHWNTVQLWSTGETESFSLTFEAKQSWKKKFTQNFGEFCKVPVTKTNVCHGWQRAQWWGEALIAHICCKEQLLVLELPLFKQFWTRLSSVENIPDYNAGACNRSLPIARCNAKP